MKQRKINQARPLTLLELMIVITLVAMTFSVLAFQIPKAFRAEAFSQSVEKIIAKIELAQEIMLDYNADISLVLTQGDKKIISQFVVEKGAVDEKFQKLNTESELHGITSFIWNGKASSSLPLPFNSSEHQCAHGTLTLKGPYSTVSLFLPGHPGKILKNPTQFSTKKIQSPYPEGIR